MGYGNQSRLTQGSHASLRFIFTQTFDEIRNLKDFSLKRRNPSKKLLGDDKISDPQSGLDQDNSNRSFSTSLKPVPEKVNMKSMPHYGYRKIDIEDKRDQQNMKDDEKELEMVYDKDEGRLSDYENRCFGLGSRSPSFRVYLTKSASIPVNDGKDNDADKTSQDHEDKISESPNSNNEVPDASIQKTDKKGRRFMKARSRAVRRNLLILRQAISSMRLRVTMKKLHLDDQ